MRLLWTGGPLGRRSFLDGRHSVQEALPVQETPLDKRPFLDRSSNREAPFRLKASSDRRLHGRETLGQEALYG